MKLKLKHFVGLFVVIVRVMFLLYISQYCISKTLKFIFEMSVKMETEISE